MNLVLNNTSRLMNQPPGSRPSPQAVRLRTLPSFPLDLGAIDVLRFITVVSEDSLPPSSFSVVSFYRHLFISAPLEKRACRVLFVRTTVVNITLVQDTLQYSARLGSIIL